MSPTSKLQQPTKQGTGQRMASVARAGDAFPVNCTSRHQTSSHLGRGPWRHERRVARCRGLSAHAAPTLHLYDSRNAALGRAGSTFESVDCLALQRRAADARSIGAMGNVSPHTRASRLSKLWAYISSIHGAPPLGAPISGVRHFRECQLSRPPTSRQYGGGPAAPVRRVTRCCG